MPNLSFIIFLNIQRELFEVEIYILLHFSETVESHHKAF